MKQHALAREKQVTARFRQHMGRDPAVMVVMDMLTVGEARQAPLVLWRGGHCSSYGGQHGPAAEHAPEEHNKQEEEDGVEE